MPPPAGNSDRIGRMRNTISFLLLLAAPGMLNAQAVSGTIYGSVSDDTTGAIVGAKVTVVNTNTNYTRDMPSQADGSFRFPSLPLGTYQVTVEQPGFNTYAQQGITLQVDQQLRLNVTLRVGNVS